MGTLKYDYNEKEGSLFIYIDKLYDYDVSEELNNTIILDYDINHKLVAIEILNL